MDSARCAVNIAARSLRQTLKEKFVSAIRMTELLINFALADVLIFPPPPPLSELTNCFCLPEGFPYLCQIALWQRWPNNLSRLLLVSIRTYWPPLYDE